MTSRWTGWAGSCRRGLPDGREEFFDRRRGRSSAAGDNAYDDRSRGGHQRKHLDTRSGEKLEPTLDQGDAAARFDGRDDAGRAVVLFRGGGAPFERLKNGGEPFVVFRVFIARVSDEPLRAETAQINLARAGESMGPVQGNADLQAAEFLDEQGL